MASEPTERDLAFYQNTPLEALNRPDAFKATILQAAADLPAETNGVPTDYAAYVGSTITSITEPLEPASQQAVNATFGYDPNALDEFRQHYYKNLHVTNTPNNVDTASSDDWRAEFDSQLNQPTSSIDYEALYSSLRAAAHAMPSESATKDEAGHAIMLLNEAGERLPPHAADSLFRVANYNPQEIAAFRSTYNPFPASDDVENSIIDDTNPDNINSIKFGGDEQIQSNTRDPLQHISSLQENVTYNEQKDGSFLYLMDDNKIYVDEGPRIVMAKKASENDDAILLAMSHGVSKFGGVVELTGTAEFKARAMEIMAQNGLDAKFNNPTQYAQYEALKQTIGAALDKTPSDNPEFAPEKTKIGSEATKEQLDTAIQNENNTPGMLPNEAQDNQSEKSIATNAKPSATDNNTANEAENIMQGMLVNHGEAPYKHDDKNNDSYWVTLTTNKGNDVTHWGVDLKRVMDEEKPEIGSTIALENVGRKEVTLTVPELDKDGNKIGMKEIDTHRNEWHVEKLEAAPSISVDVNQWRQVQKGLLPSLEETIEQKHDANLVLSNLADNKQNIYFNDALKPVDIGSKDITLEKGNAVTDKPGSLVISTPNSASENEFSPRLSLYEGNGQYLQGFATIAGKVHHVIAPINSNESNKTPIYSVNPTDGKASLLQIGKMLPQSENGSRLTFNLNGQTVDTLVDNKARTVFAPYLGKTTEDKSESQDKVENIDQARAKPEATNEDNAIIAATQSSKPSPAPKMTG